MANNNGLDEDEDDEGTVMERQMKEPLGFIGSQKLLDEFQQYGQKGVGLMIDEGLKSPTVVIRTLIQLGHETEPAVPHTNFLGQKGWLRPNIFRYAKSFGKGDYIFLLTGFQARLFQTVIHTYAKTQIKQLLLTQFGEPNAVNASSKSMLLAQNVALDTAASCLALVASHPLEVVGVNMIAQLVGGETRIAGVFSGLAYLYANEGVSGFYRGILPACIETVTMLVTTALLKVAIRQYVTPLLIDPRVGVPEIAQENLAESVTIHLASLLANPLFYPFHVVKTIMIINGNGLRAGLPPTTEIFDVWTDCLFHLYQQPAHRGLQRGVSNMRRFTYVE